MKFVLRRLFKKILFMKISNTARNAYLYLIESKWFYSL